jgi:GNAT superfamily N-acetyltransferase
LPNPSPHVRPATRDDLRAVGESLAAAFFDDPVWRFLVPADRKWTSGLPYLFRHAVRPRIGAGAWVSDDAGAAAIWTPPGGTPSPLRDLTALPRSATIFGLRSFDGLRFQSAMRKHRPPGPHWYLAILGTRPEQQGRGLGTAVLQPALARCDADGLPAYLESSKETNIPFYERHGFHVVDELRPVAAAPPLWAMTREPHPPADDAG